MNTFRTRGLLGFRFAFVFSICVARCAYGQGATASITGTLRDTSGAVAPMSAVTAQSVESGRQYSTVANEAGIYTLAALPPGRYGLTVERTGSNGW